MRWGRGLSCTRVTTHVLASSARGTGAATHSGSSNLAAGDGLSCSKKLLRTPLAAVRLPASSVGRGSHRWCAVMSVRQRDHTRGAPSCSSPAGRRDRGTGADERRAGAAGRARGRPSHRARRRGRAARSRSTRCRAQTSCTAGAPSNRKGAPPAPARGECTTRHARHAASHAACHAACHAARHALSTRVTS